MVAYNELEIMWKEPVMMYIKILSYLVICLKELRKSMKNLSQDNWCPS
jgi:hypothetical protein